MILLLLTTFVFNRVKRKKLTSNQLYGLEFRNILAVLNELKISKSKDETLDEFSVKCKDKLALLISDISKNKPDIIPRFTSVMNSYESFIYSNRDIDDEDLNEISGLKEKLLILMKKVYGATYLIHKMRLYISSSIRG